MAGSWSSGAKVNAETYESGDRILFEAGNEGEPIIGATGSLRVHVRNLSALSQPWTAELT